MAKKKKKPSSPAKQGFKGFGSGETAIASIARRQLKQLKQAPLETFEALRALVRDHPDNVEAAAAYAEATERLGLSESHQLACEQLARLQPDRAEVQIQLFGAYLENRRLGLLWQLFQAFQARFPNSQYQSQIGDMSEHLESALELMYKDLGVSDCPQRLDVLILKDRINGALNRDDYETIPAAAEAAFALAPHCVLFLHLLSSAYWNLGDPEQALATVERGLAIEPDDRYLAVDRIRFQGLLGDLESARANTAALAAREADKLDDWVKLAEAYVLLDEPTAIVDLYEQAERACKADPKLGELPALLLHYTAVACAKLGDTARARSLWELESESFANTDRYNYNNILLPAAQRHTPWAMPIDYWLPYYFRKQANEFSQALPDDAELEDDPEAGDRQAAIEQAAREWFAQQPFLNNVPHLLRVGGPDLHHFLCGLARLTQLEPLRTAIVDYALSDVGADKPRIQAAQTAVDNGWLPNGPTQLWVGGQQREILLVSVTLTNDVEPEQSDEPEVEDLLERADELAENGDWAEAIALLQEAQTLAPEVKHVVLQLALYYEANEQLDDAHATLTDFCTRHPDFITGTIHLGQLEVKRGDLEAAETILTSMLQRGEFHWYDFTRLCILGIVLNIAKNHAVGARSWLNLGKESDPDYSNWSTWEAKIARIAPQERSARGD